MKRDVAIVGGGLLGRLLAWRAALSGLRVELFDANDRMGSKATAWVAGGMVTPQAEAADAEPELVAMGRRSLSLWPEWLCELPTHVHYRASGTLLLWQRADAGEATRFQALLSARYPELRVEIELYSSDGDPEPREDVDVFFKVRAPRDSARRVRPYPGTKRGLFASPDYIAARGEPVTPDELVAHTCIGSGTWKLSRGTRVATPNIVFRVVVSDPIVHQDLVLGGLGIAILPLYVAKRPDMRSRLLQILPLWSPEPITLCALFSGPARLSPKVQVLLDYLGEYVGTDRDPRLQSVPPKGLFADPTLEATFGP